MRPEAFSKDALAGVTASARGPARALLAAGVALVLHQLLCKSLLFRNLEYTGSDLFGLLDQSWSWLYTGRLLQDNAYGNQAAIHNYYLLPALSPLTIGLGAYGLFVAVALLQLLAAIRLARSRAVDTPGRVAALAGLVSPLAFYALDDPVWGFHPELLYPSLALLLALALLEQRPRQALLLAVLIVLVKEDGALVCGGVLGAYYARRLWLARAASPSERSRIARQAAAALAAAAAAFAMGMLVLWWVAHATAAEQSTAADRLGRSLRVLARTLDPAASPRLRDALGNLLFDLTAATVLLLLPLAARLGRGLALLLVAAPPLAGVLIVSAAHYKFIDPLLAQRIASLLALAVACVAIAGAAEEPRPGKRQRGWSSASVAAASALSWGLQLALLSRIGYPLAERANLPALRAGRGFAVSAFAPQEVRFWHCVAGGLPDGTPVAPVEELRPFFHRESIVFQDAGYRAAARPRLRVLVSDRPAAPKSGSCVGPRIRELTLEVDCDLLTLVDRCS